MLIKDLSRIPGVSGDESRVRSFIKEKLSAWGMASYTDSMGNLYVPKKGTGENTQDHHLMLTAHMDEVGLLVASVEKSGHLRFYKVGGVDEQSLVSKPVTIGKDNIKGVIGAKAIHLQKEEERKKELKVENLYIDIGASSKEEAEKVVKVGEYAAFFTEPAGEEIITGKALDNRAGCAALLELLRRDHLTGFTAVFTVQEEVGCRGGKVASYRLNPKVGLVVEATGSFDTPEVEEKEYSAHLGKGPALTLMDGSSITHPRVLERLVAVAEENKIPYQFRRYTGSFTEAGTVSLSREGVLSGVISTPCRYIHTPVSLLQRSDWEHTVDLLEGFIRSVNEKGLDD